MNLKIKIKNIIENEEWYQDIIDTAKKNVEDVELVKVIDEGHYYPTYLDAMYALKITGLDAKKYAEIENFREDVSHREAEIFLYESLPVLDIPEMGDVCYLFKGKSFGDDIKIYKLKKTSNGGEFIMSEDGFIYLENKKNIKENKKINSRRTLGTYFRRKS